MSYNIEIARQAFVDLEGIHAGIAEGSPDAADRVYNMIELAFNSLADFPNRYVRAPESVHETTEIRQVVVGNYRILFRVLSRTVQILRVRHVAQQMLKPGDLN